MPNNPKTVRLNWVFKIECVDCGSLYIIENPDPSIERVGSHGRNRLAMLVFPNECPDCHNLRVLKKEEST